MTVRSVPIFLQAGSHPAEETRLALSSLQGVGTASFSGGVGASDRAHGVVNSGDFAVTQRAAGANMSVDVAAGHAWVRGTESQHQGAYHVYNDATVNLSLAASDATNPRIDLVLIRVQDAFYSGSTDSASVAVVTGTPAASPADPSLPANALVLARVRVAATTSSIGTANITDVRTRAASGSESYTRTGFKNQIMNGDFRINQRGFSSSTTNNTYGFDRWKQTNSGGTVTYSAKTFTDSPDADAGRITGYEAQNYARLAVSGQSAAGDFAALTQVIEDVRTFAGSTITISFYARAKTSTLAAPAKMAVSLTQTFGSGGTFSADVPTPAGQVTLTTTWARYSVTVAVPTIANKNIGTTANTSGLILNLWASAGSTYNTPTGTLGIQSNTFDIWGVQVERGGYATAFEERPLQVELGLVQRYYEKSYDMNTAPGTATTTGMHVAYGSSGTNNGGTAYFKANKRITNATVTAYSATGVQGQFSNAAFPPSGSVASAAISTIGESSFMFQNTSTASSIVAIHWTANAEF